MPGYKQKHSCQNTGYSNRSDFTYNLALHFSILLENEISKQQSTYGTKINFFFKYCTETGCDYAKEFPDLVTTFKGMTETFRCCIAYWK